MKNRSHISRGFLLLTIMGLLSLLLVLCIGFLVTVRTQSTAASHVRNRVDLINLAFTALDWTEAQMAARIFDPNTDRVRVDSTHTISSTLTGSDVLPWYKDLAINATHLSTVSGLLRWDGSSGSAPLFAKRETKWVYLPSDYVSGGGLRARMAIQVLDTNAYTAINDGLEDAMPTQAQQSHILQCAMGWSSKESARITTYNRPTPYASPYKWKYAAGNNLFRYNDMWRIASHTLRSQGEFNKLSVLTVPDANKSALDTYGVAANDCSLNTVFFNADGPENCLTQQMYFNGIVTGNAVTNDIQTFAYRAYTDPDTGRSPLNVNTCFNSGEAPCGPKNNGTNAINTPFQSELEGVFNVGSLRRIIKIGSFYASASTNSGVSAGMRYLDPYLYYTQCVGQGDAAKCPFAFDTTTRQVRLVGADGVTEVFRNAVTGAWPVGSTAMRNASATPSVVTGAVDPATIGTLNPVTGAITLTPGRAATTDCLPRELTTEGTVDPATVTIDPIDGKMSYAVTPVGSGGRPYTYKTYDDLYAMLNTEEKVQVEKLKTKLALQYQETLTRYFVASYKNHGNEYVSFDATTLATFAVLTASGSVSYNNKMNYKNYYDTYTTGIAGGNGKLSVAEASTVKYAALKYDYSAIRFPYSVDVFRSHVKDDLIAMTVNNNNIPLYTAYSSTLKDGGEYVNFDDSGDPEICPGKLDKRTASAIFDNICPGKRLLFDSTAQPNIEIRDPLTLLSKRRIGIDEEAISYIEQPKPTAPSSLWIPHGSETAALVNNKRMNDPYSYFLYTEDQNENGVFESSEDLGKWKYDSNGNLTTLWPTDPEVGGTNPNGVTDVFNATASQLEKLRERGQEVWTADAANPVKGRDYLTTAGADRFIDENIYFNTALNPIWLTDPAKFDQTQPNCLIHPLPQLAGVVLPLVTVKETSPAATATIFVKDSNGYWLPTVQGGLQSNFNGNSKFDTIEYISDLNYVYDATKIGTLDFSTPQNLNSDDKTNAYYRTPERQLMFSHDCFSRELTTSSVSYMVVVTVELCDAESVARNPTAPIIVAHSEINATLQLAPDIEGAAVKEAASDYVDPITGTADKANDPGLRYRRINQPTLRKTRTYESDGSITTYNTKTGLKETYDPLKVARGEQMCGGILDQNSTKVANQYSLEHTSCARQWIDPLSVPDTHRDAYYRDPHQNKRRIMIKDLINLGSSH